MTAANEPQGESQGKPEHDGFDHETASDIRAESVLLERAIGGWRGMID